MLETILHAIFGVDASIIETLKEMPIFGQVLRGLFDALSSVGK